tara:strand:+ start:633 stop:1136 length:504 start_codon:yes stop_codon:yes gene_type:complete
MFASYNKHSNELYNKLVELSRNKFFYNDLRLADNFETRVLLIFFHFIIILRLKKNDNLKKKFQELFDNIFQNIEINIRELGYGDTKVNNTMKNLNKIFYDILYKLDNDGLSKFHDRSDLLNKYFFNNKKNIVQNTVKLAQYMDQFNDFCFDLNIDNVLKGSIEFKLN